MPSPEPTAVNPLPPLEVFVFGSGKGESTVLRLPDGQWAVIDCYTAKLDELDANPIVRFLRERNVTRLRFVCLTHPHDDHYRGMSHLFEAFEIGHFWRFNAFESDEVADRVTANWEKYHFRDAHEEHFEEASTSLADLVNTFSRVNHRCSLKPGDPRRTEVHRAGQGAILFRSTVSGGDCSDYPFCIRVVAPDNTYNERYIQAATRGEVLRHNHVSLALLITYGERSILLGGDVECPSWAEVVAGCDRAEAPGGFYHDVRLPRVCLIKVCHHASENGHHPPLWDRISPDGSAIAVLTPYIRFQHPQRLALRVLTRLARSIYVTNRRCLEGLHDQSIRLATHTPDQQPRLERLERQFAADSGRPKGERTTRYLAPANVGSYCSFQIPPVLGIEIEPGCHGDAGVIDATRL